MISRTMSVKPLNTPAPKSAASSLDQAITQAETSAFHLNKAQQSTRDSYFALDGYQSEAVDVSRDTPYRDVAPSAHALHRRADSTTMSANDANSSHYEALQTLDWAVSAIDQALPDLSGEQRQEALQARAQLSQRDALWYADVALGNALATMNGGALPYIESAEADIPGTDVSWTGGEIYGDLRDTLGYINQAGGINSRSLQSVNSAVSILRDLRQRI
jgi:hypothetical protein